MAYFFVFVFVFAFSYYFLFYRRANTHPNTPLASSSSSSPSAPAFSSRSWKHHVFLSFRGEDTRNNFVGHLYTALENKGIQTYKDDKKLSLGEEINPSLIEAIEQSQIAIIVFSANYADSSWCLNELKHIMKCRKERGLIVVPIFYGVDPSEVRKQQKKYGKAFAKHKSAKNTNVASWREALVEASGNCGQDFKSGNLDESELIKNIVNKISKMIRPLTPRVNDNLVGIEARMESLISELQIGSGGVVMIGIWGVGGGGKTTLATSVYSQISGEFDGCCCIENIREQSSQINGLATLQGKIISSVLKQKEVQVGSIGEGKDMIRDMFSGKKVLIVLDDVDHRDQLEALAGACDWFGEGSRIIITTRNVHLLKAHIVVHNIELLHNDDATKLLRKCAGLDHKPIKDYEQLTKEVVFYAGGLPLALTVLGADLYNRGIDEWKSTLARLKKIPPKDIVGKLRISYDGLTKLEQDLFLDIACFFRQEHKDDALPILDACGLYPDIGLKVLREKALITISGDGKFGMHDLVQEMGHHVVRGEHPDNPEKHSRIWKEEDVLTICAMDATADLDMIGAVRFRYNTGYPKRANPLQHLPPIAANAKNLRWIDWEGDLAFPLLTNFPQRKLCCLILRDNLQEQLWEGYKLLPNLKIMELYNLENLTMLPNFAGLPNLESFGLYNCRNLQEVHSSFGDLEKLVFLSIVDCRGIKKFPPINGLKNLKTLSFRESPGLFQLSGEIQHQQKKMENLPHDPHTNIENHHTRQLLWFSHAHLTRLDLMFCKLRDEDIGSSEWELPHLQQLHLSGNEFSRLDFGLLRLPRLKWLSVSWCISLVELSNLPSSIAVVTARGCDSLARFGDTSNCKWLWKVSNFGGEKLDPFDGERLLNSMLQGNAIEDHCISLTLPLQIPKGFVAGSFFRGPTFTCLHPEEDRDTFTLHLPDDWYNDFSGFLLRLVTNERTIPYIAMDIIMKQEEEADEEDSRFEIWQDAQSDVQPPPPEPEYDGGVTTHVGYVSFSSLRRSTSFNPSYNIISFEILDSESISFAAELVPVKSKDDHGMQTTKITTNCSEFQDEEADGYFRDFQDFKNFEIVHDSKSNIEIHWRTRY